MQGPWLLLVLATGVQAFSSNGTLEEVQVSSQPLRVAASHPGQEADVRPLPRKAREESGVSPAAEGGRNRTETEREARSEEGRTSEKEAGRNHMKKNSTETEREARSEEGKTSEKEAGRGHMNKNSTETEREARSEEGRTSEKEAGRGHMKKNSTETERETRSEEGKTSEKEAGRGHMKKNSTQTEREARSEEGRTSEKEAGRGHMKKMKKTLKKMMPYLLVPGMMAIGYAPFILASLKMFVMNAVMLNMMAFNAAIFITLRNMVFGPRVGQHVKYYNFGYPHRKKQHHH